VQDNARPPETSAADTPPADSAQTDPALATAGTGAHDLQPRPLDLVSPQFTLRAVVTGMLLGGAFSVCNVYAGLRVGMAFNMSVPAILLSYGIWSLLHVASGRRVRPLGILENNISQTGCSAGALVASAGLTAPIPALAMMTGQALPWDTLALWVFSVCLVGIAVGVGLRRQMLLVDKLPFAVGIASAETLREMYGRGREALARVLVLVAGAVVAAAFKLAETIWSLTPLSIPARLRGFSLQSLTLGLDPTLLLYGVGGLIGLRTGISLLIGAILAWGVIAPPLLHSGHIRLTVTQPLPVLPSGVVFAPEPTGYMKYEARKQCLQWKGIMSSAERDELLALSAEPPYQQAVRQIYDKSQIAAAEPSFRDMLQWTLWPGVTLMVVASLVSFGFSWRSIWAALTGVRRLDRLAAAEPGGVRRRLFIGILVVALGLSVGLQVSLFAIVGWAAVASVLLSFVLALVGARVSGETGITPVAPMGKVSQVLFGAVIPQSPAPNLMAANVTGGAASQCADLLHDYKCGYLIGASPRWQTLAQIGGALAGALVASAAYLALVRRPAEQLLTAELPAPGVAGMKAVAELFQVGFRALPSGTGFAMLIAAAVGILLPIIERLVPPAVHRWLPSAASIGMAFVLSASVSFALFIGGLVAFVLGKWCKGWTARFLLPICAGLIAGESITGVGVALFKIARPWVESLLDRYA
jgi:uncharacterized oligopeptide transporter (OPT) family protein